MFKIKDDNNKLIYEGNNGVEVFRILNAEPEDISEEDEISYETILRNTEWTGKLRLLEYDEDYNLIIKVYFRGIDDWNRPVFKDIDRKIYYGSTTQLFNYETSDEDVVSEIDVSTLEYFGESFNCEPHGGLQKGIKLVIVE